MRVLFCGARASLDRTYFLHDKVLRGSIDKRFELLHVSRETISGLYCGHYVGFYTAH